MYTILIANLLGIAVAALWVSLGLWGGWILALVLATIVIFASMFVVSRLVNKRLEPRLMQVQRQIQGGSPQLALKTLEGLLPLGRWQLLFREQLYAQMGSIQYGLGDEVKAQEMLKKSSPRAAEGQLILASIYHRKRQSEDAKKALENAMRFNKKNPLLFNTAAFLQLETGDRDGAIATLVRGLKSNGSDHSTKENLNRLRNGKRMSMRSFGLPWYSLKLEKPPASVRQAPGMSHPGIRRRRVRG